MAKKNETKDEVEAENKNKDRQGPLPKPNVGGMPKTETKDELEETAEEGKTPAEKAPEVEKEQEDDPNDPVVLLMRDGIYLEITNEEVKRFSTKTGDRGLFSLVPGKEILRADLIVGKVKLSRIKRI